jgi:UDP-N-acetylglucosamine/UDP-N-acetylgalactosamine diphosphorylase
MPDLANLRRRLEAVGQEHVLSFHDQLPPDAQRRLVNQVAAIDIEGLPALIESYVKHQAGFILPTDVRPAPYYPSRSQSPARPWDRAAYHAAGEKLLRAGKVAAFVVAGGQGSRLGYEGPKGCYPAGAVTGKALFQIFAEGLLGARDRYGVSVPWYVLTSPLNNDATVAFFKEHSFFGLNPKDVMFIVQGVMPSFELATGKMLLAAKDELATNPDGHGGSLKALHASGALADMKRRGVEHISYFQVDNPIVRALDPVFIGLHAAAPDSSGEMSSKMIPKAYPEEKLGVFCSVNGKVEVLEYSDLPMDLQRERLPDGSLRFLAGSIAVHMLGVGFVERLNTDKSVALPYHRAEKKVPHVDLRTGEVLKPADNNAVKLERFVFDALAFARKSIVLETDRVEEFAPIKNAEGVDSPESSRRIQTERATRWLESQGVKVPRTVRDGVAEPDCVLEISPRTATCAQELAGAKLPPAIHPRDRVAL